MLPASIPSWRMLNILFKCAHMVEKNFLKCLPLLAEKKSTIYHCISITPDYNTTRVNCNYLQVHLLPYRIISFKYFF